MEPVISIIAVRTELPAILYVNPVCTCKLSAVITAICIEYPGTLWKRNPGRPCIEKPRQETGIAVSLYIPSRIRELAFEYVQVVLLNNVFPVLRH